MYYVYVLVDEDFKSSYVGFSSDLKRRLAEHRQGNGGWSKRLSDPRLFYYEAYEDEQIAREREHKLKQRGSAKAGLFKRIGLK
jgi:putative endonuclease